MCYNTVMTNLNELKDHDEPITDEHLKDMNNINLLLRKWKTISERSIKNATERNTKID